VWYLRHDRVVALGLVSRIVPKPGSYMQPAACSY
jgi:hypothetical protein